MNSHTRSLMFLLGLAPLGLGCNNGNANDRGDDGTGGTDDTGSTGASGDGSTTDDGGTATDDGGTTTGSTGDLCEDYGNVYGACYDPGYAYYAQEWCEYMHDFYQEYSSPACLAAWEATIECRIEADCFYGYYECEDELLAQIDACYYDGGVYNGCDLLGQMVGECVNPSGGADAQLECDQTYESLYAQHGGWCGDAFLEMMVCISSLDCQALSDKQYVFDNCGPQIQQKNLACQ